MKKLNDYIVEQEINESENWFIRLFKAAGKAMKTNIKNKFADKYPNWYKEYEALEKVTNIEEAKKKIDALLAAVDDMPDYKDDTAKAAAKLGTLYTKKGDAEEAKNKELVKLIDSKIKEIRETNPKAQKQFEDELKQSEKENGGGEVTNPAAEAVGQNKSKVENVLKILNLDNNVLNTIARRMQTMFNPSPSNPSPSVKESLSLFEGKAEEYREFIKTLYNDDKSKQEMNIVLTTLFLAYEKLKECAQKGGSKMNPDNMRALLSGYEKAKEGDQKEVKKTAEQAAKQK